MIDTHCHIDLYENPMKIAEESEQNKIITIGMTNLPSHYLMGAPYVAKFKFVRLALGMHPLNAAEHNKEWDSFVRNIDHTSYIGEIGLDFSREGMATKSIQIETFCKILNLLKNKKKVISIHSRGAEKTVLQYLEEYNIKNAIFHWYSGAKSILVEIIERGYYFSINPAMIVSKKGQNIIKDIPIDKILAETDGPYTIVNNRYVKPKDVKLVYEYLSIERGINILELEKIIDMNFYKLIEWIKSDK